MNPLKEFFESGQTILWIETQNTVAFLGPVPDILVWTPCPTACLAESLCLRQVRLAALQLLSQLLLLTNIHPCPKETLENLPLRDRNTHTTYVTNLSIRPHNSFCEVECKMVIQHFRNALFHERAIFRVYKSQIFFYCWRVANRIKTIDPKQLGGPVAESGSVECPAAHMGKALPLAEIELALLKRLISVLAISDVLDCTVEAGGLARLVFLYSARTIEDAHFAAGTDDAVFHVIPHTTSNDLLLFSKNTVP